MPKQNPFYQLELDAEEKEIEASIDQTEQIKNFEQEKSKLKAIAKNSLNKTKNINIRLSQADVFKLKSKATKIGLPYQSLVASVLHQYANKQDNIKTLL